LREKPSIDPTLEIIGFIRPIDLRPIPLPLQDDRVARSARARRDAQDRRAVGGGRDQDRATEHTNRGALWRWKGFRLVRVRVA